MTVKKYIQAQRDILIYIVNNGLQVGDCLVEEETLSNLIGVSNITTRRALKELAEAGIIERQQGKGTFLRQRINHIERHEVLLYITLVDDSRSVISWDCDLTAVTAEYGFRLKTISCQKGKYEPLLEEMSNVSGILISGGIDAEYAQVLRATKLPFLMVGDLLSEQILTQLEAPVIDHDWGAGGRALTEYFIEQGAKRIALLNGGPSYAPAVRIAAGYREALEAAGLEHHDDWISWSRQGYWGIRVNEFFRRFDWRDFDAVIADAGVFPHLYTYMLSRKSMLEQLPVGMFRLKNDFHPAFDDVVTLTFEGTLASRSVEVFADLTAGRMPKGYRKVLLPVQGIQGPKIPEAGAVHIADSCAESKAQLRESEQLHV